MGGAFLFISVNVVLFLSLSTVTGNAVHHHSSSEEDEANTCPDDGDDGEADPVCPPNEEYVKCAESICRALNCTQRGRSIPCAPVNKSSCTSKCVCEAGYLRNKIGDCIPSAQCYGNLECEENEVVDTCPGKCLDDYCPTSENDETCPFKADNPERCGRPICKCTFNYRRDNDNGTCIPTRDCPPFECNGVNEEYNPCPPSCPSDDCSQATPEGNCPFPIRIGIVLECKPICTCIKGFWRDEGICVPYSQCPNPPEITCDENEEVNECPNECDDDSCPDTFEFDTDKFRKCENPVECEPNPRCQCMEDYSRNADGLCIPTEDCPIICPNNEVYSNCTQTVCRAQNCNQSGRPVSCPKIKQGSCQQGCVCKEGYLRNEAGSCVLEDLCGVDLDCDINEEVNYCPRVCDNENCPKNLGSAEQPKCNKYNGVCQTPKCSCIAGFARDPSANGTCIPVQDCPEVCPNNEEYSNCTQSLCRAQKCNQYGRPVPCPKVKKGSCQQGCVCKEGYLRNSAGECVLVDLCGDDLECDINEEVNYCPRACDDETCPENLGSGEEPKCNKYNGVCLTPKCACVKDYARDETGTCIRIQDCPDVCPTNEEYSNCTQTVCRAQNCNQSGRPVSCPKIKQGSCQQGCVCKEGYLRNEAGSCVLEDLCGVDLDCDINEEVNYCPRVCDDENCPKNLGSAEQPKCNKYNGVCQTPKCSCIAGFARDPSANGTCIPVQDCPEVCPNNEEYSNCTQSLCRAQKCNQYGRPVPCPKVKKGSCQQGCVCKEGYLRNSAGECVLVDLCGDDLECDINEEVNYCPRACDDETCPENLGSGEEPKCNKYNGVCLTPKCSCVKDYARDETGTCIRIQDCPDVCPTNEEYSNCTQTVCRAQNCNQSGRPVSCPKIKQGSCQQGCVCKEGYLRNEAGSCVLEDLCGVDLDCDINEEVNYCPRVCDDENCPKNLGSAEQPKCNKYNGVCQTPKCSCIAGFARDPSANGTCIPVQDCPEVCPNNEEYSNCTQSLCRAQKCNQYGRPVPCPKVKKGSCQQGCVCKEGYLRNSAGECVLVDLCGDDLECDINEEVNYCPRACDDETCPENLGSGEEPKCNKYNGVCLTPKCACVKDYARDETGTCIRIQDCPDVCPTNEEYSNCTQTVCRAQNCNQSGRPVSCPKIKQGSCQQGCVCKEGYLRNEAGSCVLEDLCGVDLDCDINEEVNYCPRVCDDENCPKNLGSAEQPKCNKYNGVCQTPKCSCIAGFARDPSANGTCIPVQDCPEVCPNNEEYSNCTQSLCRAQKCNQYGRPVPCPKVKKGSCQQGCVCKEGYLRNSAGECVLVDLCGDDLECDINEEVNYCPRACDDETCPENLGSGEEPKCNKYNGVCLTPKCSCVKDYARDETGTCIRIQDCPDVCPTNEEYSNCTQTVCRAQNCNQSGRPVSCPKIKQGSCQQGCVCKEGYLRNEAGSCVLEDLCGVDLDCDINEEVNYCPRVCDDENCPKNLGSAEQPKCNKYNGVCQTPKCSCIAGFARDPSANGTCIPVQDCPEVCPNNEEYSNCTQSLCRAQKCNQYGRPVPCPKVKKGSCQQGCVCKEGYLRNSAGECVLVDLCGDDLECDINEEVNYCPRACDDETCPENLGSGEEPKCNKYNGVCLTPKCACVKDYARDETGTCIRIQDCPDVCPTNEEYSNCTQTVCRAQNCNQSGRPVSCPKIKQGSCQQGCVCKEGYLRNEAGSCVLEDLCGVDLDCDINEEVNYCPRVCDDENCPKNLGSAEQPKCNKYNGVCQTPKCSCIAGFARDPSANGTCIPVQDCPEVCPNNEEYSNCTQSLCRAQKCNQYGRPVPCPKVKKGSCQQGCVCKEGYLRNSAGECVLVDLCGDDLECDINEEVNYCPRACDDETCPENLGSGEEPKCNKYNGVCLTPKCSCVKDYARDETGTCIRIQDCPDVCPTNEEYSNCTQTVCRAQNCNQSGRPVSCPKIKQGSCQQGCVCKEGYLRNEAGSCVLEDLCGVDLDCDINEEVNYCPRVCDDENCPKNLGSAEQPKCNKYNGVCQTPKCSCIAGFARDPSANGTCIPVQDCPEVCPNNEEYSNCTQSLCRAQKCNQYGRPVPCPKVKKGSCQQGCVCKEGYLRNSAGECVLVDLCGDDLECDINEEVNYCPRACDDETCPENLGSGEEPKCNKYNGVCLTPKCSCVKDYARDETGTCIRIQDCPDVCPTNEEYSNCTQTVCRAQNCNQSGRPVSCPKIKQGSCQQGCVCKEGYLRNEAGSCVLEDLCGVDLDCDINEEVNYCPRVCDDENCPKNLGSAEQPKCNKYNGVCQTPKCSCIAGFARDPSANGTCIPVQDCPEVCPNNEEYSNCTQSLCRAQKCNQYGRPVPCPKVKKGSCQQGCVCKEGYLRNSAGECVLVDLCGDDLECDINEEVNYCPRACDDETCPENLGSGEEPKCNKYNGVCLTPKCSCVKDYARDETGTCIRIQDCPDVCPTNEEYSNCTQTVCRAQNCNQSGRPVSCPKIKQGSCQQGCVCKEGYLRNEAGSCVLEDLCGVDLDCDINEEVNYCPRVCDDENCPKNLGSAEQPKCNKYNGVCQTPKCSCIAGFARDPSANGTCIPVQDCPEVCPNNEEYSNCTQSLCRAQKCNQYGRPVPCPKVKKGSCQQGCVCKEGYLRNSAGECVLVDLCGDDLECDINEEVNYCPRACDDETCPENLGSGEEPKCNKYNGVCLTPKCACVKDYARDETGTCIRIQDCPDVCPTNEEYSNCTQTVCRAQNCNQSGRPVSCPKIKQGSCQQGCVCKEGYLRNEAGSCVLEDLCGVDLDCDINEEVNYCPRVCDDENCPKNLGSAEQPKCNKYNGVCQTPKCSCIAGFARDPSANGTCIPVQDCPEVCPNNEEYSNCTQSLCRAQKCSQYGKQESCHKVKKGSCEQGCVCMEGYLRNEAGNCVLEAECSAEICSINEEYTNCIEEICRPQKCSESSKKHVHCKKKGYKHCESGCVCVEGTFRNKYDVCVPKEQCKEHKPQCTLPNEESLCVKPCPPERTCKNRGIKFSCIVDEKPCEQKCVCKKGYVRNTTGECISEDECESTSCSDPNEEYVDCKRNCGMDLCSSLVDKVDCDDEPNVPGCTCKPGFLRKKANTPCVPICECPQMRNSPDCKKTKPTKFKNMIVKID